MFDIPPVFGWQTMAQQIILADVLIRIHVALPEDRAPPDPMVHHHFPNIKWQKMPIFRYTQISNRFISSSLGITMISLCCSRLIPEVWGPGGFFSEAKHLPEDLRHSDPGEYDQVP